MEQLRQQIPSVTDTLQQLRQNLQDRKIGMFKTNLKYTRCIYNSMVQLYIIAH